MLFRRQIEQAADVAKQIKTEVGKAGEIVLAAIMLAGVALIVAVVALVIGMRSHHVTAA